MIHLVVDVGFLQGVLYGPDRCGMLPTASKKEDVDMGDKKKEQGFSRRTFLKGTALSGAMGASLSEREAAAKESVPETVGPNDATLQLKVNGQQKTLKIDTDETLVEVLRDRLGLTGAKIGCDRGACGACTVLVDGTPRASCLTLDGCEGSPCGNSGIHGQ